MDKFNTYLTDDIAEIARELHNEEMPKIVLKALEQIINSDGVDLGEHLTTIYQLILEYNLKGKSLSDKMLVDATNRQDFQWETYNKCMLFCEDNNIEFIGEGRFLSPDVEMPETIEEAVTWFTVAEIKDILKSFDCKVSGKRTDLEQRLIDNVSLGNLHTDLIVKREAKIQKAFDNYLRNKYGMFARFVWFRALFLDRLSTNQYRFRHVLEINRANELEQALAKQLSDGGYDSIIVDGKLAKLQPMFAFSSSLLVRTDFRDSISEGGNNCNSSQNSNQTSSNIISRLFSQFK